MKMSARAGPGQLNEESHPWSAALICWSDDEPRGRETRRAPTSTPATHQRRVLEPQNQKLPVYDLNVEFMSALVMGLELPGV